MTAITITLPLPDKRLHAHNKGHWRNKATATKAYRQMAMLEARRAGRINWRRASLSVRLYWPDKRRRDNCNALQSLKPAIDGCVDSGIISDDCWAVLQPCSVESFVDRENPRVELTFREIKENVEIQ